MVRLLPLLLLSACATLKSNTSAPRSPFTVKVTGHGPPMLFIPGLSSPGEVWDEVVAHYQDQYECHVLSLAGFAGQPAIDAPLMPAVQNALKQYVSEKNLKDPVVVGHSLGGFLGLWLASAHPDLVGRLIIVDAAPALAALQSPTITPMEMQMQASELRTQMRMATPDERARHARAMGKLMVIDASKADRISAWSMRSDLDTVTDAFYFVMTQDLRPELGKVRAPTLVMGTWLGYRPYLSRADLQQRFSEQYAGCASCTVTLNDRAKHFVMLDDPEGLIARVDLFLKSTPLAPIVQAK